MLSEIVRTIFGIHPKPDDVAVVLAQGEGLAVSQHLIGKVLRRGRPNRPEKREPNLDDRSSRPQLLDRAGWVAQVFLAGEIRAQRHGRSL
jgi:hypothetical protein